jgi:hypothetical protein
MPMMSHGFPAPDDRLKTDVVEQLDRMLADEQFSASRRSSRFLRYIVEQTLAGRASDIKELVIAAELYENPSDYDSKAHSTVRVEASRLRARLQRYYLQKGALDPIHISIPKGRYVPRFERTRPFALRRACGTGHAAGQALPGDRTRISSREALRRLC